MGAYNRNKYIHVKFTDETFKTNYIKTSFNRRRFCIKVSFSLFIFVSLRVFVFDNFGMVIHKQ